jgi:glycosyltransferase involved in cell wall biosynthesis
MNDPATPDISLIVNTFQKPGHLALVLDSIARQEGVDGRFELIVSDDGSTDETPRIVESFARSAAFRVAFTTLPHDGFQLARNRNEGAKLARGRTLLFLDGDCVLPRDHVAAHLERRRTGRALLGFCARLAESESRSIDAADLTASAVRRLVPSAERASLRARHRKMLWYSLIRHPTKPRLAGGNFSVWRDDYERVNGFDERFRGWGQEDDDLGLRLVAAGVRLESVLDRTYTLHVWHPTDPTATKRWRDGPNVAYLHRRGRLTVCRHGLVRRDLRDLGWRLPSADEASPLARAVREAVGAAPAVERPEVDVVVRPGSDRFGRRAECRMLVTVESGTSIARQADVVIDVADALQASGPDPEAIRTLIDRAV